MFIFPRPTQEYVIQQSNKAVGFGTGWFKKRDNCSAEGYIHMAMGYGEKKDKSIRNGEGTGADMMLGMVR